jgi:hypothetical protein
VGNLVLLHAGDNMSAQDVPPVDKEGAYAVSPFILTKSLARRNRIEAREPRRVVDTHARLNDGSFSLTSWDQSAVLYRQNVYISIVRDSIKRALGTF